MARKPAKVSQKATVEPTEKGKGRRMPQPHGGVLVAGAGGGRENGLKGGRPASELRKRLAGSLAERVQIAEAIADGAAVKDAEIPLLAVLQYAECPKCGGALKKLAEVPDTDVALIRLKARESATPRDRLSALDLMAKYGIGTKDEVTLVSPDVRLRLERTVQIIAQQESWTSEDLLARLDAIWSTED